jgi:predicted ATPase
MKKLRRLKVKNYKSLKSFDVAFGDFNVLIGENASGKSNILDCLKFLSEAVEGNLGSAVNRRGGYNKIVFGGNKDYSIEITVEFEEGFYSFSFCEDSGLYLIKEELNINRETVLQYVWDREKEVGRCEYIDKKGEKIVEDRSLRTDDLKFYSHSNFLHSSAQKFKKYIESWKFYKFSVPEIRKELDAKKSLNLNETGGNLAQVLHSLLSERPKIFAKIEETLKLAIPEIEELLSPLTEQGKTYVAVREKGFKGKFDYAQISDGTLRLLAFITAINLDSGLTCFEEPENFVHPRLLKLVVEILKNSEKQVIISTHSPYLLDYVNLEDLIIVKKEEGKTKTKRIEEREEKERVRSLLSEGIPLGEAYFTGAV